MPALWFRLCWVLILWARIPSPASCFSGGQPTCNTGIQNASIGVQPGTEFMPGSTLLVRAHFQSGIGSSYFWLVNGSRFTATDHNAQITETTDSGCGHTVSLSWISAGPADGGVYEIILVALNEDRVRLNITIRALPEHTTFCTGTFCKNAGTCLKPASGPMYCHCKPSHHGPICQYSCQDIPDSTTVTGFAVDLGCRIFTYLICLADVPAENRTHVLWTRNGAPAGPLGMSFPLAIAQASLTDTATYSCYNGNTHLYTIKLTIQSAPVLDPVAVQQIESSAPHNATWQFPISFPIAPSVSPAVTVTWIPVSDLQSTTEAVDRADCLDNRNQYSENLILPNTSNCNGCYLGTATNPLGSVGFAVCCATGGPEASHPKSLSNDAMIAIAVSGLVAGIIIGVAASIVVYFCYKRKGQMSQEETGKPGCLNTQKCPRCGRVGILPVPVNGNNDDNGLMQPLIEK